jgi:maleamate amidohydrolase
MASYEERGYGQGAVGFGEKPGIVIVDFQRAFTDPAFPTGGAPLVRQAVENTARLLAVARAAAVPVAACYMAYHSERDAPHWKVAGIAELRDGDPGTELDPLIADPAYDYVLRKGAPSIFFNTPAASFFAKNRVDTMIVTGCITSGCVRASVVDSFSLGFRTIVPADCVGDHELRPHEDNLRDVERRYADVSTCDDVIRQIEAWQRRNESK